MNIAFTDSFRKSLEKIGPSNAPSVWQTVAELGRPGSEKSPGLRVEPIENAPDNFRSAKVNDGFRIIFAKLGDNAVLLHVDTHDEAYEWAERTRCKSAAARRTISAPTRSARRLRRGSKKNSYSAVRK